MTHKVDISKGANVGTVSAQWANRPDDQRFLTLDDLHSQVDLWASASEAKTVLPHGFEAAGDDGALSVSIGTEGGPLIITPTHYGFGELAKLAEAPAGYLRSLPAELAADCLNAGFKRNEPAFTRSAYILNSPDGADLRCLTSEKYGRIYDRDVVDTVRKMAGNGAGDTHWKVPGVLDWSNMTYNANVDVTKDNTTLYASDRDVFVFLVDDLHPIEVGKLKSGEPDLMFRGFYVWNSEVGARTFGVATMYLRGVCMNRNLWGVEGFNEVTFRHTSGAPQRFLSEAAPALESFAAGSDKKLISGVKAAKAAIVSKTDEERVAFLQTLGFSKKKADEIIFVGLIEEEKPAESLWDHAQAITAYARQSTHQDARLDIERIGGKLLDRVSA